jgi:4-amino-4-deoxy-L-arabinose transferase-like glycosyltransferase
MRPFDNILILISNYKTLLTIISLSLVSFLLNYDKAFHVDDAAHLEFAEWISNNPLHPLSGSFFYGSSYQKIYSGNQPSLFFYLMAAFGKAFGFTEHSMHFLQGIFSCVTIWAFFVICKSLKVSHPIWLTVLLSISPAFIIGQNTMVDVPLLAVWNSFYAVLLSKSLNKFSKYTICGLLCSIGLLIKYTSLVLIPILLIITLMEKDKKYLIVLLIPIISLIGWSVFNIYDYGNIHILSRHGGPTSNSQFSFLIPLRTYVWFVGVLGAISPFVINIFYLYYKTSLGVRRYLWGAIILIFLIMFVLPVFCYIFDLDEHLTDLIFNFSFLVTGITTFYILINKTIKNGILKNLSQEEFILLYWVASTTAFISLFAAFMATRYVLPILPPILVLFHMWFINPKKSLTIYFFILPITLTFILSSTLVIADIWYADIYRKNALLIKSSFPENAKLWTSGPWGWSYYSTQAGMTLFDPKINKMAPGDFIVLVDYSEKKFCYNLQLLNSIIVQRKSFYQKFASINFYSSDMRPWQYSNQPIEKFRFYKVLNEIDPLENKCINYPDKE